jgi:D-glycero-alpha-D-manno-heptose-7-phosphate kinase
MRDLAFEMRKAITGDGDIGEFAALLHQGWELKRSMGLGISDEKIDGWYEAARRAGAAGGKLLGAGGGGFLLILAEPERHAAVLEALGRPRWLPARADRFGSRIIFISDRPRQGDGVVV